MVTLATAIETVHADMVTLATAIETVHADMVTLATAIETVHADMVTLATAIETVHADMVTLATAIETVHADMSSHVFQSDFVVRKKNEKSKRNFIIIRLRQKECLGSSSLGTLCATQCLEGGSVLGGWLSACRVAQCL